MQKLGYNQKLYNAGEVLAEIADVVPFFKEVSRERARQSWVAMACSRRWKRYKNSTREKI